MDRWDQLFASLEAEAAQDFEMERRDVAAQLARAEIRDSSLAQRLAATLGSQLVINTYAGHRLEGELVRAEGEWVLLTIRSKRVVVPLRSVEMLSGLSSKIFDRSWRGAAKELAHEAGTHASPVWRLDPQSSAMRESAPTSSLNEVGKRALYRLSAVSLAKALGSISRDRENVTFYTRSVEVTGLITRVASDHIDVAHILDGGMTLAPVTLPMNSIDHLVVH